MITQLTSLTVPLYPNGIPVGPLESGEDPNAYTGADIPTIEVFLPAQNKSNGSAIIIFPGGSYLGLAYQEEGSDIGEIFASLGIAAFVVKYRLPMGYRLPTSTFPLSGNRYHVPLQDAQQAIKRVRMNAVAWNLNVDKIGVIGFSAGGHLASSLGTHFNQAYIPNVENTNLRPDFMMLIYPVISMTDPLAEQLSRYCLLGSNQSPARQLEFSNQDQVTAETPPTLIMHAGDDGTVNVDNSIAFYQALISNAVSAAMLLYPEGDHGFVLNLPLAEWMLPILVWMKKYGWVKGIYL